MISTRSLFVNAYDYTQTARRLSQGGNDIPSLEKDSLRNGGILHQYFGASGYCSYTQMPNPLRNEHLEGMTVSFMGETYRRHSVGCNMVFL